MTTQTAIFYPETDGMPLPDGEFQAPLYIRVVGTLRVHFRNVPGARVNGDTFLYYIEGNPRRSVSPDCYVVFDLSEAAQHSLSLEGNNTYLLWEVGKPPDFILEIGSPSTASADLGRKRDLYAELGVGEYWRYDATGGDFYGEPLVGEVLVDDEYRPITLRHERDGRIWSHSDALNLDLWYEDGDLRFWDPVAGRWLLTHEEEQTGRIASDARAHVAETRAEQEWASRIAADARAAAAEGHAHDAENRASDADARAEQERAGRIAAAARAEEERSVRAASDARLAELEAELRRLRGQ